MELSVSYDGLLWRETYLQWRLSVCWSFQALLAIRQVYLRKELQILLQIRADLLQIRATITNHCRTPRTLLQFFLLLITVSLYINISLFSMVKASTRSHSKQVRSCSKPGPSASVSSNWIIFVTFTSFKRYNKNFLLKIY